MVATFQDVLRANGIALGWALTEAAGLSFASWTGGQPLVGTGGFSYRQSGPFAAAFGLGLNTGATLRASFTTTVIPPDTRECFFKLAALGPAADVYLIYSGNQNSNGSGFYIHTDNHLHQLNGGVSDVDTGYVWPDTAWHLLEFTGTGGVQSIIVDGVIVWRASRTSNAPSPNTMGFGCTSTSGASTSGLQIAYPGYYQIELTQPAARINVLAETDPAAAAVETVVGSGATLAEILAAVKKSFPTT